ncbi:MAG: MarC family protein [Thermodesulfobacteriota bacterium]|nr:MarC family protein [Thermodesulfobacteriota bacterium]
MALIPIFVAIDAIGILPIFFSLIEGMEKDEVRKVVRQCSYTAFCVSIGFLIVGKFIFSILGVTVSDFKVAGGILLFIIAAVDILFPQKPKYTEGGTLGVVPLGMPIIVGPATLTTTIICVDVFGYFPTIFSLVLNLTFVWFVLSRSTYIISILGEAGAKGFGKVASLFLAAIAVMMVRVGISELLKGV